MFAAASRHWRPRATAALLGWYVVVALLHALWDASRGIAVWLTLLLTNTPMQWLIIEAGHAPTVTPVQVHIFTILNWALLGLDGLVGVLIFIHRWRRALIQTEPGTAAHQIDATEHGQRDIAIAPDPSAKLPKLAASK
jgi:hypothetical protein